MQGHTRTRRRAKTLLMGVPGEAMNHHQLEKDIEHLEHLLPRIAARDGALPLSYWRSRLARVTVAARVPSQVSRVKRLNDALLALEAREKDPAP
jgi:hypothetical protein